jgi:hypothetical protein
MQILLFLLPLALLRVFIYPHSSNLMHFDQLKNSYYSLVLDMLYIIKHTHVNKLIIYYHHIENTLTLYFLLRNLRDDLI